MNQVFIIDDHKMVIEGLKLILKHEKTIKVIGYALNGREGIAKALKLKPNIILLDINMPEMNGIETCKLLLNQQPNLKIIALSSHKESSLIKLMLNNGAKGYVLKNAGKEEILKAIFSVNQGKTYLDNTVNEIIIKSIANSSKNNNNLPFPTLSRREKDVLCLILDEYTTQEIALKLFIGFGTVETHRRNILSKLGARNTAGLVRIALEYELHK
ncbi:MAG: response regulator transcription factor [Flavobacteriaceae bacterium]